MTVMTPHPDHSQTDRLREVYDREDVLLFDRPDHHTLLERAVSQHVEPTDAAQWVRHTRGDHQHCVAAIVLYIREHR